MAVIPERCTGCRVCELVCSEFHEKQFQPSKARIQVLSFDVTVQDIALVYQQCDEAPCQEACPSEALSRDVETNAVIVAQDLYIQCGACVEACVIDHEGIDFAEKIVIQLDEEAQMPQKCDLCSGDPQCVKYCPTEALRLTDRDPEPEELTTTEMTKVLQLFLRQDEPPLPRAGGK